MVLPDWIIKQQVKIEPFADSSPKGVVSYGVSSYGYDLRLGRNFKVLRPLAWWERFWRWLIGCPATVIDPKNSGWHVELNEVEGDRCVIPPNSFALAESLETLDIPRDVLCVCLGKSTYARCGIIVNITPLEPEWRGKVTIEISNTTPYPAVVYAGEGICQVLFFRAEEVCQVSYSDKGGRYQNQIGLTLPKVG